MADDPTPEQAPKVDLSAEKAKEGNWEAVARNLAYKVDEREADNFKLREQKRELKALIPADGARILPPDEAAALDTFRASLAEAGIETPEKLTAFLATTQANAQTVKDLARAKELKTVATVTGARRDALIDVFPTETFEIEGPAPKEGEEDTRTVFVKAGDAERVPFADYVDANKAALKPALFAESAPAPAGVPFVAQPAAGRPPAPRAPNAADYAAAKRATGDYNLI